MKKTTKRKATGKKVVVRRRIKPLRFLALLIIIFAIAFVFSGGLMIFSPRTWQGVGDFLPKLEKRLPAIASDTAEELSGSDRLSRFFFLHRAVEARLDKESFVRLKDVPENLQHAILAVEDRRFYTHHGVDFEGVARASLVNLQHGEIQEGASTITQQLVKNLFLTHEQTFGRKGEELLLALDMEASYEKDEILELYLNTIYYGSNFYGIQAASLGYFDKQPRELNLSEAAMLAGLPNAPSLYSPYVDFKMAKKRQIVVLDAMVRNGYIDEKTAEDAKIKPLYFAR
ncbi:MAG: glycosyl transferase family 51 [Selenomonas ruminantium]|nr:glycosyl transferase family 51 [Selenomonas ruminantium]